MKHLDEKKIIELYIDGNSARQIGKIMSCDTATITSKLRKNKIPIRNRQGKYVMNESYFEQINTEEKAYWLGFLMADGYNSSKFIRVDIQDGGHLEKLRDSIFKNKDMPIRLKKSPTNKDVYYLTLQSKKIVSDCEKLGIIRNKSLLASYPKINESMDRHFIRGLFDGDGSLSYVYQTKNYRKYMFSIVGSETLMKNIKEKLEFLNIHIGFGKCKSIYRIYISGNKQICKILNWMYEESNISLERKFKKYDDMIIWDGTKRNKNINKILN